MKPTNVCRHLRTKKMYIPAQADEVFSATGEHAEHSGHCWCNRTQTVTGLDDKQVSIPACNSSRSCFEE